MKDLIETYKDEILKLNKDGKSKASITKYLIETYKLEIPYDKVDSFRRGISNFINSQSEKELDLELSKPISDDEKNLSEKIENTDKNSDETEDPVDDDDLEEEDFAAQLKGAYEHKEKFWYVTETDSYYYNLPGYQPGMKLSGTLIRDLKNKYSYLGRAGGLTINQICRAVKLPRDIIIYIKTYMGWTHDSDPFTNEEMISGDIDEMVDRTLEDKKFQWFQKYTRKEQRMIEDAAQKWWQFKGLTVNPFLERMGDMLDKYETKKIEKIERSGGDNHAMVIAPFDLHYGKYAWKGDTGSTYNRKIAREVLVESAKAILVDAIKHNVERIIVPVGSDFYHVDSLLNATTRGTPQDCDGSLVQIMAEGNQLMIEFVDMLRQVADVQIILAAGNHDFVLSHALLEFMAAYYRNSEDVEIVRNYKHRQYLMYGNSLLGFTHGDGGKVADLPLTMATEAKEFWGIAEHKALFIGHLHHEMSKDMKGVKVYQMPSLAGTDRWHHRNQYVGSVKALAAYLIHPTKGVRLTFMENIKES